MIIAWDREMKVGSVQDAALKDAATGEMHPCRYRVLRVATKDEWLNAKDRPPRKLPEGFRYFYEVHTD